MSEQLVHEIENFRKEKDSRFGSDPDSPIPGEDRLGFKGLKYFPANPDYRGKARLTESGKPVGITMTTSKGTVKPYVKYGLFNFQLQGKTLELHAYKAADDPHDRRLR